MAIRRRTLTLATIMGRAIPTRMIGTEIPMACAAMGIADRVDRSGLVILRFRAAAKYAKRERAT